VAELNLHNCICVNQDIYPLKSIDNAKNCIKISSTGMKIGRTGYLNENPMKIEIKRTTEGGNE